MSLSITRPTIPVPLPLTRGGTEATTPAGARANLELGDLAQLTAPGGTSTFLRADKTWAVPPGGGGGGGDVSSSTGLSVDTELVVFDGTTGKLLKRGTGSGLALLTNGVLSIKAAPVGAVVGTTDTQTLTGKTISGTTNTLTVRDLDSAFTDVTTANVSTTAHGLTPKAPGGTTQFLRGDATWAAPPTGTSYTDEQAQDAVGAMLLDTATIDLTYTDATPALSANVNDASITEAKLSLSDVTTRDASTTAHGLLRKLSGSATQYLDGSGAWTTPAGGGDNYWSRVDLGSSSLASTLLAFWPLEEATGNRVDSVSGQALVPTGTTAQVSNGPGKIGQALVMDGTAGTYLSIADTPVLSAGTGSFTVAVWVYPTVSGNNMGIVGKGSAAVSTNNVEYMLWMYSGNWYFVVGNGSTFVNLPAPETIAFNQWTLLIGWYDAAADQQYIQVNNGTPTQIANAAGSHDGTLPFEVGRTVGFASQSWAGRIDLIAFDKRVWTPAERTAYWNNGNGLAYPFAVPSRLSPATAGDQVLLAATALTTERLEVESGIKLGTSTGTVDGIVRWSGTEFEGRKAGAWVPLTRPTLPLAIAEGGTGATTAPAARTALGLGTLATQAASAVAITGGGAVLATGSISRLGVAQATDPTYTLAVTGDAIFWQTAFITEARVTNVLRLSGGTGFLARIDGVYARATHHGIILKPDADSGPGCACTWLNAASAPVGSITTTASATAYNTSSDVRLKESIATLVGALDVVRALRPVSFRWQADGSQGHGFLAHELQVTIPEAVSGLPEEVNDDGSIKPQQVDHSRLVPWLTACCQELAAQVQALGARVQSLEEQLGI